MGAGGSLLPCADQIRPALGWLWTSHFNSFMWEKGLMSAPWKELWGRRVQPLPQVPGQSAPSLHLCDGNHAGWPGANVCRNDCCTAYDLPVVWPLQSAGPVRRFCHFCWRLPRCPRATAEAALKVGLGVTSDSLWACSSLFSANPE